MTIGDRGIVLRHLNTLFSVGMIGELTDAQLLERFTSHRDETAELAFAALVERSRCWPGSALLTRSGCSTTSRN